MNTYKDKAIALYAQLKEQGLLPEQKVVIENELKLMYEASVTPNDEERFPSIYDYHDMILLQNLTPPQMTAFTAMQTLDELLENDKQREKDGFPRRIRIGKLIKPTKGDKAKVVIVPTTTEPKLYHDDSLTQDGEENTGGAGEGEEGDVLGEQQAKPEQGEGEGTGAGEGEGAYHDVSSEAFDLGKVLTEKFELPNLKEKGKKHSLVKYQYDLTDINRRFGQVLDKKATLKQIIETNILLGKVKQNEPFSPEDLLLSPQDYIYRILSKEKDYESQAMVFFLRDYSGSMDGKPTEVVSTQHLLIYSWLMYQYQNNVETRFILHDTEAKQVPDFYTYHKSKVAGGTKVAPAFQMVNKMVETEQLATNYNIYVFHGTDGDDWDSTGKELVDELRKMIGYVSRIGITVARNSWGQKTQTTVEKNLENSRLLKEKPELIRMDTLIAAEATEERIIESIKRLIS